MTWWMPACMFCLCLQETVIPAAPSADPSMDLTSLDDVPMTDMRFSLPACPSAATQVSDPPARWQQSPRRLQLPLVACHRYMCLRMHEQFAVWCSLHRGSQGCACSVLQALLYSACVELRRAGDHTAPAEAIQVGS